jgi:threonine dehydrogenase-like Zn-dependent dehydrogenase
MERAFSYVANGGKLVFVGLVQSEITFSDPEFHRREITLLSTRNSTPKDFKRIISLVEQEKVDTKPWVTHRSSFQEMISVFPNWLVPESNIIKAVVSLDS